MFLIVSSLCLHIDSWTMQEEMTQRSFFLFPKIANDLLLIAAGDKVIIMLHLFFMRHHSLSLIVRNVYMLLSSISHHFVIKLQKGGYTTANYIWDLTQARKMPLSFPAVEAYYNGLKVSLFCFIMHCRILQWSAVYLSLLLPLFYCPVASFNYTFPYSWWN